METIKILEQWIKDFYPNRKYVNSLSFKWVCVFAEHYHRKMSAKNRQTQLLINELETFRDVAIGSISHVGIANYRSREAEAKIWVEEKYEEILKKL